MKKAAILLLALIGLVALAGCGNEKAADGATGTVPVASQQTQLAATNGSDGQTAAPAPSPAAKPTATPLAAIEATDAATGSPLPAAITTPGADQGSQQAIDGLDEKLKEIDSAMQDLDDIMGELDGID